MYKSICLWIVPYFRFDVSYAKDCISFSLIIIGVCNHSYLGLWVSAVSTLFTQRNMSKVEVSNLTSRYMGKVKSTMSFLFAFFAGS